MVLSLISGEIEISLPAILLWVGCALGIIGSIVTITGFEDNKAAIAFLNWLHNHMLEDEEKGILPVTNLGFTTEIEETHPK